MSKVAEMSGKLYVTRDLLRTLFDDYPERIKPFRVLVRASAKHRKVGVLQAAIDLAGELDQAGVTPLWPLAAALDEILGEPPAHPPTPAVGAQRRATDARKTTTEPGGPTGRGAGE